MKKILAVIEVENEVINSEILNSETLLLQAFRKFTSFLLVLDLMYELYVTSFLEIFHFLIWRGTCFDAYFHNFSDVSKLFLALRRHENNEKLKLSSTIKTRCNFWCVKTACSNCKKNQFGYAMFRILIYLNPKILHISFLKPFLASVIKFFSSYKKCCRAVFKRRSCNSETFWFVFSAYI